MLEAGEEADGPATPLPGGGSSLWQLPLTSGATVTFALVQAPSSPSSSSSSSGSGAAAAVRVASVKKGGSVGAVVLPASAATATGTAAATAQRLFVSTVANTDTGAATSGAASAAAAAQLYEVTIGGMVTEVEEASPAQGPIDWDVTSHGAAFLPGSCFPHVVLKRDGKRAVYCIRVREVETVLCADVIFFHATNARV